MRRPLRQAVGDILGRLPEQLRREIYVLAFRVSRVDADDRHPYVDIGYHTESRYRREVEAGADAAEARWNYAFWILEGFEQLGNVPADRTGATLHEQETRELGFWYDGDFDLGRALDDEVLRLKSERLDDHFREHVIDLVRHLHSSGTVARIFDRPLPVVVFDMECPGWEVEATRAANPAELIEEFLETFG